MYRRYHHTDIRTQEQYYSHLLERQHTNISSILSSTNHSRIDFQSGSTSTSRPQNVISSSLTST